MIDLKQMKSFTRINIPHTTFCRLIQSEQDEIAEEVFKVKLPLWLEFLKTEEASFPATRPKVRLSTMSEGVKSYDGKRAK